jgi:hypothetical protein
MRGLPGRYVSGYLVTGSAGPSAKQEEVIGGQASHAWMEVFLPGSNDRVTRKHYIKPPTLEAIAAMRRLSETLLALDKLKMLPNSSPEGPKEIEGTADAQWIQ